MLIAKMNLRKSTRNYALNTLDSMYNKILSEVQGLEDAEDGGFNAGKLWKLKKKLSPRSTEPPTAMENSSGKLITKKEDILEEAVNHYKSVFKQREI